MEEWKTLVELIPRGSKVFLSYNHTITELNRKCRKRLLEIILCKSWYKPDDNQQTTTKTEAVEREISDTRSGFRAILGMPLVAEWLTATKSCWLTGGGWLTKGQSA